jgi:hypothetical protein
MEPRMKMNRLKVAGMIVCLLAPLAQAQDLWKYYDLEPLPVPSLKQYTPAPDFREAMPPKEVSFTLDSKAWTLPADWKIVKNQAGGGRASAMIERKEIGDAGSALRTIPARAGDWYHVGVRVKMPGIKGAGKGATIGRQFFGPNGYIIAQTYAPGVQKAEDWTLIERTDRIPRNARSTRLILKWDGKFAGRILWDDVRVEAVKGHWHARMIRPYRNAISFEDGRILVTSYVDGTLVWPTQPVGPIQCVMIATRAGKTVASVCAPVKNNRIAADLGKLSPGPLELHYTLIDPTRHKILATDEQTLTILNAADWAGRVRPVDEHGRLLVDGKPFFPIGVYLNPFSHPGEDKGVLKLDDLNRIAADGFNTVLDYSLLKERLEGSSATGAELIRQILDACHARGLHVIFSIKDVYSARQMGYGWPKNGWLKDLGDDDDAVVTRIMNTFKNHPALLGWYVSDEIGPAHIEALAKRSELVNHLDPAHAAMAVQFQFDDFPRYAGAADMLGVDAYPIWSRGTREMEYVQHGLDMAALTQQTPPGQSLWGVPQACNLGVYHTKDRPALLKKYRGPTAREMRSFGLYMVIRGANAIVYYSYFDLRRDITLPDFDRDWAKLAASGQLLKELSPALLNTQRGPAIQLTVKKGEVAARSFVYPDGRPVILIAAVGPGQSEAMIKLDRDVKLISRFGPTTQTAPGVYRFVGSNIDSDVLTPQR